MPSDFDVVWCQGSLSNVPFDFAKLESAALLEHLKPGGRWIERSYPHERWERDGAKPFSAWLPANELQGPGWREWYDLERLESRLAPFRFEPVLVLNFDHSEFAWFDLASVPR